MRFRYPENLVNNFTSATSQGIVFMAFHLWYFCFHRFWHVDSIPPWRGDGCTPYSGECKEAPPRRGTFLRLQEYKKVSISQVYKRVGNLLFRSVKGPKRANKCISRLWKRQETSWFCDLFIFETRCMYSRSKLSMWKGYYLSIEGIRKGYILTSKMVNKNVRRWTSGWSLPV